MKYLKHAALVTSLGLSKFFWLPAPSSADDCLSNLINWSDYDQTLDLLQDSYHRVDYQSVEQSRLSARKQLTPAIENAA